MRSIGCDPEVFLIDNVGKFISSIGKIGGSKKQPQPIGNGCAIQEDNVAVEFNTPPCRTADEFVEHIQHNLNYLTEKAASMNLKLSITPSAVFDDSELQTRAAKEFGCEPDYNAWDYGAVNPKPRAANPNLRSAGGHVHVGLPDNGIDKLAVVQAMDLFVGIPLMKYDSDTARRELYGKAGAFRDKSYGIEYRTPSNVWITSPELIKFVYAQTARAVEFAEAGYTFNDEQAEKIQRSINTSDLALGEEVMREFGV